MNCLPESGAEAQQSKKGPCRSLVMRQSSSFGVRRPDGALGSTGRQCVLARCSHRKVFTAIQSCVRPQHSKKPICRSMVMRQSNRPQTCKRFARARRFGAERRNILGGGFSLRICPNPGNPSRSDASEARQSAWVTEGFDGREASLRDGLHISPRFPGAKAPRLR